MRFLLDTSVYSQPLKNRPVVTALRHWMRAGDENCFTCDVCLAEVEYGLLKENNPARREKFDALLRCRLENLPVDRATWLQFSRMKATQELSGKPVNDLDLLIAATSVRYELTLATLNARHFRKIIGLRSEDWSQ